MLVAKIELIKEWQASQTKLQHILNRHHKAPEAMKQGTEHLSRLSTLFPYVYHQALVQKHLKRGSYILDWGSYLGQVTYLLQDQYRVNAYNPLKEKIIDYWQNQLKIKDASYGLGLSQGKLDFKPATFDAVISSGVLEHTFEFGQTDVEALKNLNLVLKDDGLLFIWHLPTKHALPEKIAKYKKEWKHILLYDLDDLLVKLSLAGFRVLEIERNDLIFSKLARIYSQNKLVDAWMHDYALCQFPLLKPFAHHFTLVAKKIPGSPNNRADSGYTTYT